jgi:uncharacterized protein YhaN
MQEAARLREENALMRGELARLREREPSVAELGEYMESLSQHVDQQLQEITGYYEEVVARQARDIRRLTQEIEAEHRPEALALRAQVARLTEERGAFEDRCAELEKELELSREKVNALLKAGAGKAEERLPRKPRSIRNGGSSKEPSVAEGRDQGLDL